MTRSVKEDAFFFVFFLCRLLIGLKDFALDGECLVFVKYTSLQCIGDADFFPSHTVVAVSR